MALKHLRAKAPGELTTAKEISSLYGCPFDVMSRVMQTLAQKGILRSEQGAYGGYMIMKDLSRISFHDLVEVIMGPVAVAKCLREDGNSVCEIRETCNIVSPMQNLNRKLSELYRGLTVAELLENRALQTPAAAMIPASGEANGRAVASRAVASRVVASRVVAK